MRTASAVPARVHRCSAGAPSRSPIPDPPALRRRVIPRPLPLFSAEVVAQNLEIPWAMTFAPDGRMFFTERPGRVRILQGGQVLAAPALVLVDVAAVGEGGLLGIAVHPDFATNRFVFLAYTARLAGGGRELRVVPTAGRRHVGEAAVIMDSRRGGRHTRRARVKFGPTARVCDEGRPRRADDGQDPERSPESTPSTTKEGAGRNPFAGSPIFS